MFEFSEVLHLHSKDIHISAMLKGNRVHRTSSPTGNTKNILSADPRRNASLLPDREVRFFFFSLNQEELIILAEMGLFAELEFEICLCVCVKEHGVCILCSGIKEWLLLN